MRESHKTHRIVDHKWSMSSLDEWFNNMLNTGYGNTHNDSPLKTHFDVVVQPDDDSCPLTKSSDSKINYKRLYVLTCCRFLKMTF